MIPLSDTNPTGKFPLWIIVIIAINVFVFWLQLTSYDLEGFIAKYALIPAFVEPANTFSLIPFITSQFLHGGFLHIISNMLFLWIFGDNVEGRIGYLLFPFFYLASGVAGGLAQYIFIPDSQIPMLGASGAIAGVLGAYLAWFPRHTVKTLVPVFGFLTVMNIPAAVMLVYWIFTQVLSGTISIADISGGGVAYFAHIGGFAFGWVVAKLLSPFTKPAQLEPA